MGRRGSACPRIIRRSPATSRSRWFLRQRDRMVLNGAIPPGTAANPMPWHAAVRAPDVDDEVAAVVTYIRTPGAIAAQPSRRDRPMNFARQR